MESFKKLLIVCAHLYKKSHYGSIPELVFVHKPTNTWGGCWVCDDCRTAVSAITDCVEATVFTAFALSLATEERKSDIAAIPDLVIDQSIFKKYRPDFAKETQVLMDGRHLFYCAIGWLSVDEASEMYRRRQDKSGQTLQKG